MESVLLKKSEVSITYNQAFICKCLSWWIVKAWILRSVFCMTTRLVLNTVNSLLITANLLWHQVEKLLSNNLWVFMSSVSFQRVLILQFLCLNSLYPACHIHTLPYYSWFVLMAFVLFVLWIVVFTKMDGNLLFGIFSFATCVFKATSFLWMSFPSAS